MHQILKRFCENMLTVKLTESYVRLEHERLSIKLRTELTEGNRGAERALVSERGPSAVTCLLNRFEICLLTCDGDISSAAKSAPPFEQKASSPVMFAATSSAEIAAKSSAPADSGAFAVAPELGTSSINIPASNDTAAQT